MVLGAFDLLIACLLCQLSAVDLLCWSRVSVARLFSACAGGGACLPVGRDPTVGAA